MGVRDSRHGVGHTRPGGHQRNAEAAGQLRLGIGHVDGGSLVAHIDDANAFGIEPHPDRHDVAPAQRVDPPHAALLEEARDDGGGRLLAEWLDRHGASPGEGRGIL